MGLWSAALMDGGGLGADLRYRAGRHLPAEPVLALEHSSHAPLAARLVAFMQGIGFIIAGVSPYLSGFLRSATGDYLADWIFHAACVAGLMLLTLRFAPSRYPSEWQAASHKYHLTNEGQAQLGDVFLDDRPWFVHITRGR